MGLDGLLIIISYHIFVNEDDFHGIHLSICPLIFLFHKQSLLLMGSLDLLCSSNYLQISLNRPYNNLFILVNRGTIFSTLSYAKAVADPYTMIEKSCNLSKSLCEVGGSSLWHITLRYPVVNALLVKYIIRYFKGPRRVSAKLRDSSTFRLFLETY